MTVDEKKVWNKLTGLTAWDVSVLHNFWDGSMYCSGYRPFSVLAKSADDARSIVISNLELVETYFRSRRVKKGSRTIRLIRKSESYHIERKKCSIAKKSALLHGKILNTDGKYELYNIYDYE